jgi:hypothetical protein
MTLTSINTRADLDALLGTPQHAVAMTMLGGTLWRLEKDDAAKSWTAVLDETTITRFGLTIADFTDVQSPELPEYVAPELPPMKSLSAWQVRKVLTDAGLRDEIEAAVALADQNTRDAWAYAGEFRRDSRVLNAMAVSLGMTDAQLDELFELGATL